LASLILSRICLLSSNQPSLDKITVINNKN
jgi:hypothetical protein